MKIAEDILDRLKEKYQEQILVGGIYGSTAGNEDIELSYLDIILITKNGSDDIEKEFIFKDIPISYRSVEIQEAEDIIKEPDFSWAWTVNSLVNFEFKVGDEDVKNKPADIIEDVPLEKFKVAIEEQLPNIYAYNDKVQKYYKNKEINNLLFAMWDLLNGLLGCIALLNKEYFVRNDFYRFEESFRYSKIRKEYEILVKKCYSSKDSEEIINSIQELFDNFEDLLDVEDVAVQKFSQIVDIDI